MRIAVFAALGLYASVFAVLAYGTARVSTDAAGRGMAWGFLAAGVLVTLVFALPALVLALGRYAPRTALRLALVPGILLAALVASGGP